MKGFGIYVKNDLLDPKHVQAMGEKTGLWLYLWFLDHMTSISEDGVGKVLGGKPITFEQVEAELSLSRSAYTRWTSRLKRYGYIEATRTPYGLVIDVYKATKIFGNRDKSKSTHLSDKPKVETDKPIVTHQSTRIDASNRDNTVDSTNDNTVLTPGELAREWLPRFLSGETMYVDGSSAVVDALAKKGIPIDIVQSELKKFALYWTEPTKSGKKQRWELQPTFDIRRRLATWFTNVARYAKPLKETKGVRI